MRRGFSRPERGRDSAGRHSLKDASELERTGAEAQVDEAQVDEGEAHSRKEGFFELRYVPSARRTALLGLIGALAFLVSGRSDII